MAQNKRKIFASDEKCMEGPELARLRGLAGLTQEQLAAKMDEWGWYREKVARLEECERFCLYNAEMQALLEILGARMG